MYEFHNKYIATRGRPSRQSISDVITRSAPRASKMHPHTSLEQDRCTVPCVHALRWYTNWSMSWCRHFSSWLHPPPSYQDFLADSYGSASLFFISTCFQLQKLSVWLGNSRTHGQKVKGQGHQVTQLNSESKVTVCNGGSYRLHQRGQKFLSSQIFQQWHNCVESAERLAV